MLGSGQPRRRGCCSCYVHGVGYHLQLDPTPTLGRASLVRLREGLDENRASLSQGGDPMIEVSRAPVRAWHPVTDPLGRYPRQAPPAPSRRETLTEALRV
jgi:hypothetical protein